jgi:DNA-binding response OmpR family regulator
VFFGGHCRRWAVLAELAGRYDFYYPRDELIRAVWGRSDTAFQGIELGTFNSTVSRVREALRPLGIDISFTKGLGYRLEATR